MIATNSAEFQVGLAAVQAAAQLTEAVRAEMVQGDGAGKLDKQDRSPVTVADFGAQALVCRLVSEAFPQDTIVAEESSAALQETANAEVVTRLARFVQAQVPLATPTSIFKWIDHGQGTPGGRFWVLDPIDGTKGFLRDDQYAVALALIEDGAVQWGFLGCPALPHEAQTGVIFVAQRGAGAQAYTLDGVALGAVHVSGRTDPAQARMVESVEAAHTNRGLAADLQAALAISAESVRMDSQAKYAAVARGDAEIYLRAPNPRTPEYREMIWDHAAGWLVVVEAGGRVTDIHGQPLDWTRGRRLETNAGVVATNGLLHDAVIGTIAAQMARRPEA